MLFCGASFAENSRPLLATILSLDVRFRVRYSKFGFMKRWLRLTVKKV
jgi:hypothetical protein